MLGNQTQCSMQERRIRNTARLPSTIVVDGKCIDGEISVI